MSDIRTKIAALQHTPGPWGCIDTSYHAHDYRLTRPDGRPLPLVIVANDHSEQRANARLIAAAPDLLAALTAIASGDVPADAYPDLAVRYELFARAALAKLTGDA